MSMREHPDLRRSLPKGECKSWRCNASHPNHTMRCKKAHGGNGHEVDGAKPHRERHCPLRKTPLLMMGA
jgi:hypothetical protein